MTTYEGAGEAVELLARSDGTSILWRSSDDDPVEMARWDPAEGLLTVFPRTFSLGSLQSQFTRITELQLDCDVLRGWVPDDGVEENDRGDGLELSCLPSGFGRVFRYGLGIKRAYRGLAKQVDDSTSCTAIRFSAAGPEGPDGAVFQLTLDRFTDFKRAVDRNRSRATTVAARVNSVEGHNAIADLLGVEPKVPTIGRHPVVVAMTRELTGQHVLDVRERGMLVRQASKESRIAARQAPEDFGRLRKDIELVALEVLMEQFDSSMAGVAAKDEGHWQSFFQRNTFALQQLFAVPVALFGDQLTVKPGNALGQGARIADFVLVNTVTRSALLVEIKTPAAGLSGRVYRGKGGAEVYPPHAALAGAVTQLQAQMESVRTHLPALLRETPGMETLDTVSVRGAVIAGTAAALDQERAASFLRYRDGLADIEIVAFDEVRDRLEVLRALLSSESSLG
jgi:hypothetical protein